MPLEFYKVLHLTSLFWMFASFGGLVVHVLNGGTRDNNSARKLLAISHGVALLLVFVSGFGMHAKLQLAGFPLWFLAKIVLWLALGGLFVLPYRMPQASRGLFFALPVLGAAGAWLALYKPF